MVYEEIANSGYKISDIKTGDFIPVDSGYHFGSLDKVKRKFLADFDYFKDFFNHVDDAIKKAELQTAKPEVAAKIKQNAPGLGKKTFNNMMAFLLVFDKELRKYTAQDDSGIFKRNIAYENTPKLSDVFKNGTAACVEVSSLLQYYMQSKGFKVFMINGKENGGKDDLEAYLDHTYNVIIDNGKPFICDILKRNLATVEITKNQEKQIQEKMANHDSKDNLVMIETKNIFYPNIKRFYGFGTGRFNNPNAWISKNNIMYSGRERTLTD